MKRGIRPPRSMSEKPLDPQVADRCWHCAFSSRPCPRCRSRIRAANMTTMAEVTFGIGRGALKMMEGTVEEVRLASIATTAAPTRSITLCADLEKATPADLAAAFPDLPEECEIIDVHASLPAALPATSLRRSPTVRLLKFLERLVVLSGQAGQEKLEALLDEYAITVTVGGQLLYQSRGYVDQIIRKATGGRAGCRTGAWRAEPWPEYDGPSAPQPKVGEEVRFFCSAKCCGEASVTPLPDLFCAEHRDAVRQGVLFLRHAEPRVYG